METIHVSTSYAGTILKRFPGTQNEQRL